MKEKYTALTRKGSGMCLLFQVVPKYVLVHVHTLPNYYRVTSNTFDADALVLPFKITENKHPYRM